MFGPLVSLGLVCLRWCTRAPTTEAYAWRSLILVGAYMMVVTGANLAWTTLNPDEPRPSLGSRLFRVAAASGGLLAMLLFGRAVGLFRDYGSLLRVSTAGPP